MGGNGKERQWRDGQVLRDLEAVLSEPQGGLR